MNAPPLLRWLREAAQAQREGRNDEAEPLLRQVLHVQPYHHDALHRLGAIVLAAGRAGEAAGLIQKALVVNADDPSLHCNLGIAFEQLGKPDQALAHFDRAIALAPALAAPLVNRGNVRRDTGHPEAALRDYDAALARAPELAEAHSNRGQALLALGRIEEALAACDEALAQNPHLPHALRCKADALMKLSRPKQAAETYRLALALMPDSSDCHAGLAEACFTLGRHEAALEAFEAAIKRDDQRPALYSGKGMALHLLRRFPEALAAFDSALALEPEHAYAFNNRGATLIELGRLAEAEAMFRRCVELRPDFLPAQRNLAKLMGDQRRYGEMFDLYSDAVSQQPGDPESHFGRAVSLLQRGHFAEGWRDYEARLHLHNAKIHHPSIAPRWNGEPCNHLLVTWEQGLGDTIQFSRFLAPAKARAARVTLLVQQPLLRLFKQCEPAITVVSSPETTPDAQIQLLSLPALLLGDIPPPQRLRADPALRAEWQKRLGPRSRPRVGLVWRGNPAHANDRARSIDPVELLPLLGAECDYIALQPGHSIDDKYALRRSSIRLFENEITDFADTAALLDQMDWVISVDTAVAHLAGAMGKECWLLLPYNPDWRWQLDRGDSPWYPALRLFRQTAIGDWQPAIADAAAELRRHLRRLR